MTNSWLARNIHRGLPFLGACVFSALVASPAAAACFDNSGCGAGLVCVAGTCMRVPTPASGQSVVPPQSPAAPQAQSSTVAPIPSTVPSWPYGQPAPYGQQPGYPQTFPSTQQQGDIRAAPFAQTSAASPGAQVTPRLRPALYCYTEPPVEGAAGDSKTETEEPSFGRAGQMVFWGGGATFLGTRTSSTSSRPSSTASTVDIAPSFGFFLSKLLLLRAATHIWRQSDSTETQYGFGLETGVGFNVPVGHVVSLLPELRIGIGWVEHSCSSDYYYSCSDQSNLQYWNGLGMPILFHLAPHLFIGAGPALTYTFAKTDAYEGAGNVLGFSLQALIGGWL
jgi:hypothetical protein